MDNPEKFSSSKEVIAFLAETFPACFSIEGEAKPLKVGIFQDLCAKLADEPRVSKTLLRSTLRHYTNSWRYLHSIKEGAHRVDLNGEQDAAIDKEHAEHALQQLTESKQKVAERRKEQQKKKPSDKKSYKNKATKPLNSKPKGTKVAAGEPNKKVVPVKLTDNELIVGTRVTVKIGKAPMPATITEVGKDGVHVQLTTGMTVKVQADNLRLASETKK
ncbi:RNA chaperone ProQ [Neptunicella sp. SCSIO 80796]|uniref:RNA chaperone ProQ n=1 Tax=Neptunicella plasticusilytica TaxID=3117012 RepID=UPI003A4DC07D